MKRIVSGRLCEIGHGGDELSITGEEEIERDKRHVA